MIDGSRLLAPSFDSDRSLSSAAEEVRTLRAS